MPEILRFLGLPIDESVSSDLKYAVEMLSSKDPKIFFSGLKILAAIHESNDESSKRDLAEKILSMLCKVMPSYVKRGAEIFELNKTKIEESVKSGKHPLDLKSTIALAKRGSLPAQATDEKVTGFVMTANPAPTTIERGPPAKPAGNDADDIKVISIEDVATGEEELVAMAKQDAAQESAQVGAEGQEPAAPAESLDLQTPEEGTYEDDEWVRADSLDDVMDNKLLFDKDGKITKEIKAGLNLINPVEREKEIDLNYSSVKGYHDPYSTRTAPPSLALAIPPETFVEPEMGVLPEQEESTFRGVDIVDAMSMVGQPCGLGDGDISASDSKVYVCPYCKAVFHEGCGKVVLKIEGGRCPACDAVWK
nr:hypothetical protein [Candidatus Sigynarchaeum springense]